MIVFWPSISWMVVMVGSFKKKRKKEIVFCIIYMLYDRTLTQIWRANQSQLWVHEMNSLVVFGVNGKIMKAFYCDAIG